MSHDAITIKINLCLNEGQLYRSVRAGFSIQGTSLSKYCIDNDILYQSACKVLRGDRDGPKAKALRQRIIDAAFKDVKVEAAA